jgi:hypothetical protein
MRLVAPTPNNSTDLAGQGTRRPGSQAACLFQGPIKSTPAQNQTKSRYRHPAIVARPFDSCGTPVGSRDTSHITR